MAPKPQILYKILLGLPVVVESSLADAAVVATLGLACGLNRVLLWGEKILVLCVVTASATSEISLLSSESSAVAVTLGLVCGLLNLLQRIERSVVCHVMIDHCL